MQPPLDLKQILPFPLEPAPTLGLFSNYSTVSSSLPAFPTLLPPQLLPSLPSSPLVSNSLCLLRAPSPLLLVSYKCHWLSGILVTAVTTNVR